MFVGALLAIAVFYFIANRNSRSIPDLKPAGDGVPTNIHRLERDAAQGDAGAANNLGSMYAEGAGVPKDDSKALKWFQKAAALGDRYAQYNLAVAYERGLGVPQDSAKALEWYRKSAAQGSSEAENSLGLMYAEGNGVPRDGAKAVEWYRSAAAHGSPEAELNLGRMYQLGDGAPKDFTTALAWYHKAAAHGNVIAQATLTEYEKHSGASALSNIAATSSVTTYAQAQTAFWAQPMNGQRESYLTVWDHYNQARRLDEKDGCYLKAKGPSRHILVINASGTVVQFLSDPDSDREICLRYSYLGVQFPKPPYAPFYVHLDIGDSISTQHVVPADVPSARHFQR